MRSLQWCYPLPMYPTYSYTTGKCTFQKWRYSCIAHMRCHAQCTCMPTLSTTMPYALHHLAREGVRSSRSAHLQPRWTSLFQSAGRVQHRPCERLRLITTFRRCRRYQMTGNRRLLYSTYTQTTGCADNKELRWNAPR